MKKIRLKDGRTGTLVAKSESMAIVKLDGFEESKKRSVEFMKKHGEHPNEVPWLIEVKPSEIEEIV